MKKIFKLMVGVLMLLGATFSMCSAQQSDPVGVKLTGDCIRGIGKDCFEYGKILGISRYQKENYSAFSIAQDVMFAAMYMVGTVLTIVIIYCGFMYIRSARAGKETNTYRKGLVNAAVGALLVRFAYTIVRLIQYIAQR